jgi:hypothetical protein
LTAVNFPTAADANSFVANVVVTVDVGTYAGTITLGGANAAQFVFSNGGVYPCALYVGASNIAAGQYHITLTTR